jgi:hypothetical protein
MWTRLLARSVSALNANPSRFAIAEAGVGLFVFARGARVARRLEAVRVVTYAVERRTMSSSKNWFIASVLSRETRNGLHR